jgi:hypothetical protein
LSYRRTVAKVVMKVTRWAVLRFSVVFDAALSRQTLTAMMLTVMASEATGTDGIPTHYAPLEEVRHFSNWWGRAAKGARGMVAATLRLRMV